MKTKPATKYALLGSMLSRPRHGYEIMQFLDSFLGSTWHVGTSQLYTLLKNLEKRGLLSSSVKNQESRPSKRVFSLTPSGREVFLGWLHSPAQHVRDLRIEFLAKLFFFTHFDIKGASELIDSQIRILEEIRARIEKREKEETDPFGRLVIGFKVTTIDTWIDWLMVEARPFMASSLPAGADSHSRADPANPLQRPDG